MIIETELCKKETKNQNRKPIVFFYNFFNGTIACQDLLKLVVLTCISLTPIFISLNTLKALPKKVHKLQQQQQKCYKRKYSEEENNYPTSYPCRILKPSMVLSGNERDRDIIWEKSRIRETKHLSTEADNSTDTREGWTKNTPKPVFLKNGQNYLKRKNSKTSRNTPKFAIHPSTRGL